MPAVVFQFIFTTKIQQTNSHQQPSPPNHPMPSFIYQLISATCFGLSNAYWKKIEKAGFSFEEAIFYRAFIGVAMLSILFIGSSYFSLLQNFNYINATFYHNNHLLYSFLICFLCSLGLVCYVPSLKYKAVGVVVSLSSVNVFGILTATLFFNEAFTKNHFHSFIIAIIGILFISIKSNSKQSKLLNIRSIALPLLAAMFWVVGYTLFKVPLQWMGALTLSLFIEATVLIVAFIILKTNTNTQINFRKAFATQHFYISGLLLVGGSVFINIALSKLSMATVNILGLFTFPVSMFAAYLFNKENPTIKEWIGITLILASIILLIIVK